MLKFPQFEIYNLSFSFNITELTSPCRLSHINVWLFKSFCHVLCRERHNTALITASESSWHWLGVKAYSVHAEQLGKNFNPWWRHQMETISALLAICAGNSPVPGEFPLQRPVTRSFDVLFDLHQNEWLSKQLWGWWFETLSCPLWRHRNAEYRSSNSFCRKVYAYVIQGHVSNYDDGA